MFRHHISVSHISRLLTGPTDAYIQSTEKRLNCLKVFHYTHRCITPKRVASWQGPSLHHCAYGQHSSFQRNVAAVASRWQHYVQFDRPEIRTSDFPRPEKNMLPLDQLAGYFKSFSLFQKFLAIFTVIFN